jgi:excisionase family DNA binding protein
MKNTTETETLLTTREVAKKLATCERTIDNLKRTNAIAFVKIGRAIRFEPSAVEAFKNSHRVNAS